MTLTEFLEWEERQNLRLEFDGFEPATNTGGTLHYKIMAVIFEPPCRTVSRASLTVPLDQP
jgi:hypothetical protein